MVTIRFPAVAEDILFDVESISDLRTAIKESAERMPYHRSFKVEVMCPDEHPKESIAIDSVVEPYRAISDIYLQGVMNNIDRVNQRIHVYLEMAKEGENVVVIQSDEDKQNPVTDNVVSLF